MKRPDRISALLVDPPNPARDRLAPLLTDHGVRSICTASSLDDAIERIEHEAFDLIIVDAADAPKLTAFLESANGEPKPILISVEQSMSDSQLSKLLDRAVGKRRTATESENVEAIVERLAAEYLAKVEQHITAITAAHDEARHSTTARPGAMRRIAKIAHDMKGQGGSFGYPIMTEIAASLVAFCRNTNNPSNEQLVVLEAHADAMRAALTADLRGDIGPEGKALLASLANAERHHPTT